MCDRVSRAGSMFCRGDRRELSVSMPDVGAGEQMLRAAGGGLRRALVDATVFELELFCARLALADVEGGWGRCAYVLSVQSALLIDGTGSTLFVDRSFCPIRQLSRLPPFALANIPRSTLIPLPFLSPKTWACWLSCPSKKLSPTDERSFALDPDGVDDRRTRIHPNPRPRLPSSLCDAVDTSYLRALVCLSGRHWFYDHDGNKTASRLAKRAERWGIFNGDELYLRLETTFGCCSPSGSTAQPADSTPSRGALLRCV